MARIAGVDLPRDKRVEIGLTYIYGIGRVSATKILKDAGVNPDTRCRDLTDDEVKKISEIIDRDMIVEAISEERSHLTSSVCRKSVVTEVFVTGRDFP